jgi:hypothetical protein
MRIPGKPPRRPREREFVIHSVQDELHVDWFTGLIDWNCMLKDVRWSRRVVRLWPYFWKTKVVWDVTFTFLPETNEERQERLKAKFVDVPPFTNDQINQMLVHQTLVDEKAQIASPSDLRYLC